MGNVFYNTFTRHADGEGLKGHATHYCPGCGHGLAHKYLAEAIDDLGIRDRTVAISPVGCSVFLYYYLDVGNSQAAHGRAPAVAIGHKMANPESIVITYQGDGDLASIGLAEIIQAAQIGIPISVIFINNAVYAMTGGQLAPTTLMGMKTTTSPDGRDRMMGAPIKMAEIIAQLDGPIYVERVALYDNKQRMRAKKAIHKAIRLQAEKRGFAFVEVLSECPVHFKMDAEASEEWVKEKMTPVFPLGVLKDVDTEPWFQMEKPSFDIEFIGELIGGAGVDETTTVPIFPQHIDSHDISLKLAGAGGDGAQTAAMLITRTAIGQGFDATHISSYGPESRGGTSYADVHIAREEVLSPSSPRPHILIAFNRPSLLKFGRLVRPNGLIIYDSSVIKDLPELPGNITLKGVPFTQIANEIGNIVVKNIVALGALQALAVLVNRDAFLQTIRKALQDKGELLAQNEAAFRQGQKFCS